VPAWIAATPAPLLSGTFPRYKVASQCAAGEGLFSVADTLTRRCAPFHQHCLALDTPMRTGTRSSAR
jgi:hypothetical protein